MVSRLIDHGIRKEVWDQLEEADKKFFEDSNIVFVKNPKNSISILPIKSREISLYDVDEEYIEEWKCKQPYLENKVTIKINDTDINLCMLSRVSFVL